MSSRDITWTRTFSPEKTFGIQPRSQSNFVVDRIIWYKMLILRKCFYLRKQQSSLIVTFFLQ